jgi:uncharacterized membrane protein
MVRKLIGIGLILLSGIPLLFYMVGNHGKLMFRPHMREDWVIWSIVVLFATSGLYLLVKKQKK